MEIKLNHPRRGTYGLPEKYLTILKINEKYDAYSIDDNFKIIKGKGSIENDGSWNNHKNEDDSENRLYFYISKSDPKYANIRLEMWWTLSVEEVIAVQRQAVENGVLLLKQRIDILESLLKEPIQ